jgi:hypothetical protein
MFSRSFGYSSEQNKSLPHGSYALWGKRREEKETGDINK